MLLILIHQTRGGKDIKLICDVTLLRVWLLLPRNGKKYLNYGKLSIE
jgi:hypothetical protein